MDDDPMSGGRFLVRWLAWLVALPVLVWAGGAFVAWDFDWPLAWWASLPPIGAWEPGDRILLLFVVAWWPIAALLLSIDRTTPWWFPPPPPPIPGPLDPGDDRRSGMDGFNTRRNTRRREG